MQCFEKKGKLGFSGDIPEVRTCRDYSQETLCVFVTFAI